MCHITLGKVKTSMLLIWAGPDGEDINENFNLPPHLRHDVDHVFKQFEEFCKPICNFHMAQFKFSKVSQHNGETVDVFYNRILKIARQCEFPDMDDHIIDANNQRGCSQSQSRQGQSQSNQKTSLLTKSQCYGCGQDCHQDKSECPAFGKTCHKCSRSNHFVNVCGKITYRRPFRSKL